MSRLFWALLFFPVISYADLDFEQLGKLAKTPPSFTGNFIQEKYFKTLDATLISSGTLRYQHDEALYWQTLEPIQNELMMTTEGVINRQGQQEFVHSEINSSPAIKIINEIFFAVLTTEWQKLATFFKLSGQLNGQIWSAELVPSNQDISQFIAKITLQGSPQLNEIVLYEFNGNKTIIHFDNLKAL
ncbi:MAG: hypothetical protein COB23_04880 [Methylophaga sp.]|nr:MAG: hypothetical protein COB23_04880 [Methylophaga sp.]